MTPGQQVRIVNPDREAHATGTVVENQGGAWPVWVRHHCDCWTAGTRALHIRGYTESEVTG